jgi:hypothetical protein
MQGSFGDHRVDCTYSGFGPIVPELEAFQNEYSARGVRYAAPRCTTTARAPWRLRSTAGGTRPPGRFRRRGQCEPLAELCKAPRDTTRDPYPSQPGCLG